MRSEKVIKNVLVTWIGLAFVSLGGFVIRIILARTMAEEYLGLNGVFGNVIAVLSMAELGVGPAIAFSLYKPIAEKDERQIKALMRLFRNFYIGVGSFMIIVGLIITPFIKTLFLKDMPTNVDHIYFIFMMYVVNAAFTYFFSYKCVYLSANQYYYLYSANHAICYVCMYIVQTIVLLVTKNFILFYSVQVATTVIEYLRISHIADKKYPILRSRDKYDLPEDTKKTIKVNVFAAMGHNVGSVILNSTDNIVISKFVGLVKAGYYSNYMLIISTLNMFMNQAFQALLAGVGNLAVEADEKQQEDTFYLVFFVNYWIYALAATCLMCLATPFIELAFGKKFVLSLPILIAIVINFYATGMRQTCIAYKSAYGILIQDVHKAYIEAILNLIVSILLVHKLGILGVVLGTIISNYAVAFWIEPNVFFKHGFKKSPKKYYCYYALYFVSFALMIALSYKLTTLYSFSLVPQLLLNAVVAVVVSNLFVVIVWGRSKSFKTFYNILKNILKKKLNRS